MHYPYWDTIFFLLAMGCFWWYYSKKPINTRNYKNWKHIVIDIDSPFTLTEEKIRTLFQNKIISKLGNVNDSVYFQDKASIFTWGNIYFAKPGDNGQQFTLYYRGVSLLHSVIDKTNLKNVISFLGGKLEDL